MLKPGLPPDLKNEVIRALKEYESAIMKAGEVTQINYKTNVHYVNIIFEVEHIIRELKNVNGN
tara:strand:+ start:1018 stop:1206 length:189 start_codon:yes stop_codon:yes gene_type:complete